MWLQALAGLGTYIWGGSLLLTHCLGAHGWHVYGGRVGQGSEQGWGELGLDPLVQEPSVTTWWGRTSWLTTSCTP